MPYLHVIPERRWTPYPGSYKAMRFVTGPGYGEAHSGATSEHRPAFDKTLVF